MFLRSAEPKALGAWYAKHLGVEIGDYGATFSWKDEVPKGTGMTAWNPFPMDTTYFGEGNQAAMTTVGFCTGSTRARVMGSLVQNLV